MRQAIHFALAAVGLLTTSACDDFRRHPSGNAAAPAPPPAVASPAASAPLAANTASAGPATPVDISAIVPGPGPSANPLGQAIDAAALSGTSNPAPTMQLLIKAEVLLDRAHFSPGVIDGREGSNLHRAVVAYRQAHSLPPGQNLDVGLMQALTAANTAPIMQDYVITAEDEKGPFLGTIPTDMTALAKLDRLGYSTPLQELAERFHMSQALLRQLNPAIDFAMTGSSILVTRLASDALPKIARVEVDKAANEVRGFDQSGQMVAAFPATVGSTERPAPTGAFAVTSVTTDPDYTYDPKRLTFGDTSKGVLTIKPGPNNPVGNTWIGLTVQTYGIHGSPDPTAIGKNASHGCVRLTNWDAAALGKAVEKGTPVQFVGRTSKS